MGHSQPCIFQWHINQLCLCLLRLPYATLLCIHSLFNYQRYVMLEDKDLQPSEQPFIGRHTSQKMHLNAWENIFSAKVGLLAFSMMIILHSLHTVTDIYIVWIDPLWPSILICTTRQNINFHHTSPHSKDLSFFCVNHRLFLMSFLPYSLIVQPDIFL